MTDKNSDQPLRLAAAQIVRTGPEVQKARMAPLMAKLDELEALVHARTHEKVDASTDAKDLAAMVAAEVQKQLEQTLPDLITEAVRHEVARLMAGQPDPVKGS